MSQPPTLGARYDIGDRLPGGYLQTLYLMSSKSEGPDYGVLFVPRGSWTACSFDQVQQLLGRPIPENSYEVKFDLMCNLEDVTRTSFDPRREAGLSPLNLSNLNSLGKMIVASILIFKEEFAPQAFYAVAVDDNEKLCYYYQRLYRNLGPVLRDQGTDPITSEEGIGYAIFC